MTAFFASLQTYFLHLTQNRFASHVLETCLSLLGPIVHAECDGGTADSKSSATAGIQAMCEELEDMWLDLMQEPGSAHVVRALVSVLSGYEVVPARKRLAHLRKGRGGGRRKKAKAAEERRNGTGGAWMGDPVYHTPNTFATVLGAIVASVRYCPKDDLLLLCANDTASPCLQQLVQVARKLRRGRELPATLLAWPLVAVDEEGDDDDDDGGAVAADTAASREEKVKAATSVVLRLCRSRIGSHLVEVVLQTAAPELFEELLQECFRGRLVELASDPGANFVVQQLLACASNPDQVREREKWFAAVSPVANFRLSQPCVCTFAASTAQGAGEGACASRALPHPSGMAHAALS